MTVQQLPLAIENTISAVDFKANGLLVCGWDQKARVTCNGREKEWDCEAPLLDCTWDGHNAYVAGLHGKLLCIDTVHSEHAENVTEHEDAISSVVVGNDCIVTGSWDKSIKVRDKLSESEIAATLPNKVFSMDMAQDKIVVGMAHRGIWTFDRRNMGTPLLQRESSLKYMTRRIKCMPDGCGYISTSIEGRVAVEYFDEDPQVQTKKYAFKCHRQPEKDKDTHVVYPINDIDFHPVWGTFATAGGDGAVALWDGMARKRLRLYPRLPMSVSSISFSPDGKQLAIACSSGYEDGRENEPVRSGLYIRQLEEQEGKGKST